jgi:hypothetical protein
MVHPGVQVKETEETAVYARCTTALVVRCRSGIDRNPMSRWASHAELRAPVARAILDGEATADRTP